MQNEIKRTKMENLINNDVDLDSSGDESDGESENEFDRVAEFGDDE